MQPQDPMQPQEPVWDRPAGGPKALFGCALFLALALAGGLGLWLVRSDRLRQEALRDEPAPTPTVASPSPTPVPPMITDDYTVNPTPSAENPTAEQVEAEVDRRIREMKRRLDRMAAETQPNREIVTPGGEVEPPQVVVRVQPVYTEAARRARIEGVVIVQAVVDREGRVVEAHVLKSLPMGLDEAAKEAVSHWKFKPATRRGEPVDCYLTLTVSFRLQ
jgi:TonB family protein